MKKFFSVVLFAVASVCASFAQPGGSPSGRFYFIDGTAALPSMTYILDRDTGFYRDGANVVAFASGGLRSIRFLGAGTIYGGTVLNYVQLTAAGAVQLGSAGTNQPITLTGVGTAGVNVDGTKTNDNAAAGYVGEYISSTVVVGSQVSLVTATAKTMTSISLTAGDWDVEGNLVFNPNAATTSQIVAGSSSTNNTFSTTETYSQWPYVSTTSSFGVALIIPTQRFSLSATTTIYAVAQCTFSAGSVGCFGILRARRVR